MFHFPRSASVNRQIIELKPDGVSPFRNLRIKGWFPPPRSLSQVVSVFHRSTKPRHPFYALAFPIRKSHDHCGSQVAHSIKLYEWPWNWIVQGFIIIMCCCNTSKHSLFLWKYNISCFSIMLKHYRKALYWFNIIFTNYYPLHDRLIEVWNPCFVTRLITVRDKREYTKNRNKVKRFYCFNIITP